MTPKSIHFDITFLESATLYLAYRCSPCRPPLSSIIGTMWAHPLSTEQKTAKKVGVNLFYNNMLYGALGAIRTRDTWLRRPVLYPLSYERAGTSEHVRMRYYHMDAP